MKPWAAASAVSWSISPYSAKKHKVIKGDEQAGHGEAGVKYPAPVNTTARQVQVRTLSLSLLKELVRLRLPVNSVETSGLMKKICKHGSLRTLHSLQMIKKALTMDEAMN